MGIEPPHETDFESSNGQSSVLLRTRELQGSSRVLLSICERKLGSGRRDYVEINALASRYARCERRSGSG